MAEEPAFAQKIKLQGKHLPMHENSRICRSSIPEQCLCRWIHTICKELMDENLLLREDTPLKTLVDIRLCPARASKRAEEDFDKNGLETKLTKMGRSLGVDFGEARTGLALSDESRTLAGPLPAWEKRNKSSLIEHLQSLIKEYQIDKIVLGFPRNLDGSVGAIAQDVQALKEELGQASGLEIVLWDERLSSVSARRHLKDHKISTKKKKSVVDTISAVLILQSYLDSQRK